MNPQEAFVSYLQDNPRLYVVAQSTLYMKMLNHLSKVGKTFTELSREFPEIDRNDLELIMSSLESLRLVEKTSAGSKVIYFTNKDGKELLEKYMKAKQKLDI